MLEFAAETHTYLWNGQHVPGVNEVLDSQGFITDFCKPRHTNQCDSFFSHDDNDCTCGAMNNIRFGNHVHAAIHLHEIDDLDKLSLDPKLQDAFYSYIKFKTENGYWLYKDFTEKRLYSRQWGFAGTLDLVLDNGKHLLLLDLKTCVSAPVVGELTTAGYKILLSENEHFHRNRKIVRALLMLYDKAPHYEYGFHLLTDPASEMVFLSALNCWKWRREHGLLKGD